MVDSVGAIRTVAAQSPAIPSSEASPLLSPPGHAQSPVFGGLPRFGTRPEWLTAALAYCIITLITRAMLLGNPVFHVDEEFYLFVGDRMLHGAIPYVDIWDRKPIALFLLYALMAALPGKGIIAYQIAGMASTVGTAMVIERLAREIAPKTAAWQAGLAYVLFMPMYNCALGQAPVFFNLPVALAALGLVETLKQRENPALLARGAGIMLLVGVGMQIKYSVVFEGVAFGLLLLARGYADVWTWRKLVLAAAAWIGAASAPTALAVAAYAAMGHADAFIQANFLSILQRQSDGWISWWRLVKEMAALFPFWLAIFLAPRRLASAVAPNAVSLRVLRLWAGAAIAGFLVFGTWYDHYVGPLLAPLSILAAPALGRLDMRERWYALLRGDNYDGRLSGNYDGR